MIMSMHIYMHVREFIWILVYKCNMCDVKVVVLSYPSFFLTLAVGNLDGYFDVSCEL